MKDDDERSVLRIDVTWDDIERGTPGDPEFCPLAWAVMRAEPDAHYVLVDKREAGFGVFIGEGPGQRLDGRWFPLPVEAQNFVVDFDVGGSVRPFSFEASLQ